MDNTEKSIVAYALPATAIVHRTSAGFNTRAFNPPVHLMQYDRSLPVIAVNLRSGEAGELPYTVPQGAQVNVRMDKADGHHVYNPALGLDSARQTVYIGVTAQMTACAGPGTAVVEVMLNGSTAGAAPVVLDITENPVPEAAIQSSDEFLTIAELVAQAAASAASAAQSASDAQNSKTAAAGSASSAANSAQAAGTSAADASSSKTAAAGSASAAQSSATAAAGSAEAAAESKTNAAASAAEAETSKNQAGEYAETASQIAFGQKGWFATPEALRAAHPTGQNGWWAVVGSTDTLWVWDSDTGDWKDTVQPFLSPPKAYAGPSPIALATRGTDKVYVDFEGDTAVSGTPSPDNPVTLTGVPFAATASDGTGQTRSISLGFTGYSLSDGVKDTYDGKTGELVRRVRRIVLGEDSFLAFSNDGSTQTVWYTWYTVYENGKMDGDSANRNNMLSTHFVNRNSYGTNVEGVYGGRGTPPYTVAISIFKSRLAPYGLVDGTTNTYVPAAKAWAKAQADAGTPVTILYEPEEPTSSCHKADIPAFAGTTTVTGAAAAGVIDDRVLRFNGLLPFEVQPSHPNLLDNPDLEINQRGKQEYTSGNTVDRWRINGNTTNISYAVGSKTLSCTSTTSAYAILEQLIEAPSRLAGKTVTFSALFESANKMLIQIWRTNSSGTVSIGQSSTIWSNNLFATLTCVIPEDVTDSDTIRCLIQTQDSVKIIAAKLELGSQQTLARKIGGTWVLNDPPPNKALELAKCQRYYNKIDVNSTFRNADEGNANREVLVQFFPMRATPAVTLVGTEGISCVNVSKASVIVRSGSAAAGRVYVTSVVLDANL